MKQTYQVNFPYMCMWILASCAFNVNFPQFLLYSRPKRDSNSLMGSGLAQSNGFTVKHR